MPVAIFRSFSTGVGGTCQQGQADPKAQGTLYTIPFAF